MKARTTCPRCGQPLVAIGAWDGSAARVFQCETPMVCGYFRPEGFAHHRRSALFVPPTVADRAPRQYALRGELTRRLIDALPTSEGEALSATAIGLKASSTGKVAPVVLLKLLRKRPDLGIQRRRSGLSPSWRGAGWLWWRVSA
jgi:hypothetical protein